MGRIDDAFDTHPARTGVEIAPALGLSGKTEVKTSNRAFMGAGSVAPGTTGQSLIAMTEAQMLRRWAVQGVPFST